MVRSYGLSSPRVHHAVMPEAERHDRTCDQTFERAMRASSSLRNPATRLACHRRKDPVLKRPAAPPGARHENPYYGLCFSSLTCAEMVGHYKCAQLRSLQRVLRSRYAPSAERHSRFCPQRLGEPKTCIFTIRKPNTIGWVVGEIHLLSIW
jgi:hypothetical protein